MLQNHIGNLKYPVNFKVKDISFKDFGIISQILIVLTLIVNFIFILGIIILQLGTKYRYLGTFILVTLIILSVYFIYLQFKKKAKEPAEQQKKYYEWGKVTQTTQKQLEALQLIAFARYEDGFWTDTLETAPKETRVKHIPKFRKRLDWFFIGNQAEEIKEWEESWAMNSLEEYNNLYDKLINGLHTSEFLLHYKKDSNWKIRLLELTGISEVYFDACFNGADGKPKKLIWAWDLWRAILLSTGAFECGFIDEKKAWEQIYLVSDISHYLFDNIEDFYKNIRLGHAFWCNDYSIANYRTNQINSFLNPKKGTERLVHNIPWTKPREVKLTENMKDNFNSYLEK